VSDGAAVRLGDRDQESVVLVEEDRIGGQMRLDEGPGFVVAGPSTDEAVAREHPPRVRVGHEHRTAGRVEKNRVSGLRTEAGHAQQLAPQGGKRLAFEATEPPPEAAEQPAREGFDVTSLHAIRPGRSNQASKLDFRHGRQTGRSQESPAAKLGDGARGTDPRRVLREDRAHGNLERCPGRPPALGTELLGQTPVEPKQPGLDGIAWRPRNPAPASEHRRR
jgi:hypothetical protein